MLSFFACVPIYVTGAHYNSVTMDTDSRVRKLEPNVAFGKLLRLFVIPFPHLQNRGKEGYILCSIRALMKIKPQSE